MKNLRSVSKVFFFSLLLLVLSFPATIKWSYQTGAKTTTDPIVIDGKVYIFSDDRINCIRNGDRIFTKELNFKITANPVYDSNSKKFFVPSKGLYQIETDGYISDSFSSNETFNSPLIYEGLLIVTSQEGNVYIFDKGKIKSYLRKVEIGEGIGESMVVAKGKVYIITKEGNVYTIDPLTGSKVKFLSVSEGVSDASPVYVDGKIFFAAEKFLYSFYLGGIVAERKEFSSWINAISYDGDRIYVSTNNGLYILSRESEIESSLITGDAVRKKVTATNSTIYVPSNDRNIYAISKNASKKWQIELDDWPSSGAYQDGILYYVTRNGTVYAISTLNCVIDIPRENSTIATKAHFEGRAFADSGIDSVEIASIPGSWSVISREENWKGDMIISGFDEGKIAFQCRVRDREGNLEQGPYFITEVNYVFSEERLPELNVSFPKDVEVGKVFKIEVYDESGSPYRGATIKFDRTTLKTDENGAAFLSFKEEGKAQITISAPNYRERTIAITVTKGLWTYLTYIAIGAAVVIIIYIFIKSRRWR